MNHVKASRSSQPSVRLIFDSLICMSILNFAMHLPTTAVQFLLLYLHNLIVVAVGLSSLRKRGERTRWWDETPRGVKMLSVSFRFSIV